MTEFNRSLSVIIGINNYSNGIHPLETAKADAEELARILEQDYRYDKVILVTDDTDIKPTGENLLKLLGNTLPEENLTEGDRFLFYFAGHGIARPGEEEGEEGPQGFLVPSDAHYDKPDSLISMRDIYEYLAKLNCRHLLVILDCCFAGAFRWTSTRKFIYTPQKATRAHYQRFTQFPAWEVITSSAYNQEALDFLDNRGQDESNGKHSPFAQGLFKALIGKADFNNDGVIIAPELYIYIRDYVEKNSLQRQTPGFFPLQKHDRGEYIFLIPGRELNLAPTPELNPDNNPYRGLKPFEQQNAHFFFGRQELIQELFTLVSESQHRLTTVVGISGSGKSSLVKAGLIPYLNEDKKTKWQLLGTIVDDNKEIIDPIRPETNPYNALANAFYLLQSSDKINGDDLKEWCEAQSKTVNPLSQLIQKWSKNNQNVKLLLIIDQFEELITLASKRLLVSEEKKTNSWNKFKSWFKKTSNQSSSKISSPEKEALQQQWLPFIELLATTLKECPQFNLVITLRSDFAPRFANSGFKYYWEKSHFTVRSMRSDELREVVLNPATERALYFEPASLADTIVDEVSQMPGALPLLSFALSELYINLYRRWHSGETENRALTLEDYQKLGGVAGSLTRRVNEEYENLPDDAHRLTMRRVMLRMVEIEGEETLRRRVLKYEVTYSSNEENQRVEVVLNSLVNARLIVTGKDKESGEIYYEPAHDFLVRGWEKIQVWIQKEQENLALQQLLTPAAQAWENRGNRVGDLWTNNSRLGLLKEIYTSLNNNWLNQIENNFVQHSLERKRNNVILRWSGVTSLLIISIAVGVILNGLRNTAEQGQMKAEQEQLKAERSRIEAEKNRIEADKRRVEAEQRRIEGEKQRALTLVSASKTSFDSNQHLNALIRSVKAGKILKKEKEIQNDDDIYTKVILALSQAVYGAKEYNRIRGSKINFSPNSQLIASVDENILTLWDSKTNESLKRKYKSDVKTIRFTSDRKIAVAYNKTIEILSVDGNIINTINNDESIYDIQVNPDGDKIVVITNSAIKVLDLDGQTIAKLTKNSENNLQLSEWLPPQAIFSPNSQSIAITEGEDIIIWNFEKETTIKLNYGSGIKDLIFSKGGDNLTVVDTTWTDNGTVINLKILKVNGEEIKTVQHTIPWGDCSMGPEGVIGDIEISSSGDIFDDGKILAMSCWDGGVKLFRIISSSALYPNLKEEIWFQNISQNITSFKNEFSTSFFSTNGKTLAIAGIEQGEKIIKLWRLQKSNEQKRLTLEDKGHPIVNVNWSPDKQHIVTLNTDGTISIWNTKGQQIRNFPAHINNRNSQSIDLSHDGEKIVVSSDDGIVNIWSFKGRKITSFPHGKSFNTVDFSPIENLIVSGGDDGKVNLWRLEGEKVKKIKSFSHRGVVTDVSFSPDGKKIASASGDIAPNGSVISSENDSDNTIKLWSVTTGEEIHTLTGHFRGVSSIDFSPDGQMLASGGFDETLRLWDLKTGQGKVLKSDDDAVVDVSFSPQGKMIAIATGNQLESGYILKLWDLDGRELSSFNQIGSYKVTFNPDGQFLASADGGNSVILFNFQLDDLLGKACKLLNDYLNQKDIKLSEEERNLCSQIGVAE